MFTVRKHISFANVISMMAIFIALGGSSYAAVQIKKNSVGGAAIKRNAITSSKVKNGSLLGADFKAGQIPAGPAGPAGAAGAAGATGPAGTAAGFARVGSTGTLEALTAENSGLSQNKNVVQANVQHPAPGVYCFGGLPFNLASAMVTVDSAGAGADNQIAAVAIKRGTINLGTCDLAHQQARVTLTQVNDTAAPALVDHGFFIWLQN